MGVGLAEGVWVWVTPEAADGELFELHAVVTIVSTMRTPKARFMATVHPSRGACSELRCRVSAATAQLPSVREHG